MSAVFAVPAALRWAGESLVLGGFIASIMVKIGVVYYCFTNAAVFKNDDYRGL